MVKAHPLAGDAVDGRRSRAPISGLVSSGWVDNGARLRLVALLSQQEPNRALCVGRLARELGVTASAVSQHLRVLKHLGLVRVERRDYRLHYYLDAERLAAYQDLAREQLGEQFVVRAKQTDA